jgi:hypothetical protein
VLVARSEILSPAFGKKLAADFKSGNTYSYYNDRYYLAYQARVDAMNVASGVALDQATTSGFAIYPNPTKGTINLFSQEHGKARVLIVNVLGSRMEQLFNGEFSAGEHSLAWDTQGLSAGLYVC